MKKISNLLWLFVIVFLSACNKSDTPAPPANNNTTPGISATTSGYLVSNLSYQNTGGFTATYTPGSPNQLFILGTNATNNFSILLKWNGSFPPANMSFNLDVGSYNTSQFGFGQFTPSNSSANNYSSYGISGGGVCTITNIDQTAKTVTGTFNFAAGYWNNNGTNPVSGQTTTFSGSFTKVPY